MDYNKLADDQLLLCNQKYVKKEKELTLEVLKQFLVIESRRLYADLGFNSLFSYCQEYLGYTKAETYVRICAMRAMKVAKGLTEKMEKGTISLTGAKELYVAIKKEEEKSGIKLSERVKEKLVEKIENQSSRETERVLQLEFSQGSQSSSLKKIVFHLDEETFNQLQKMKHKLGISKEEDLLKILLMEKEKAIKIKEDIKISKEKSPEVITKKEEIRKEQTRYIPKKVKIKSLEIADYRCQFVSTITGMRCDERKRLQFDHIRPFSFGGKNEGSNIRVLCQSHNLRAAIHLLGMEKMNSYLNPVGRKE